MPVVLGKAKCAAADEGTLGRDGNEDRRTTRRVATVRATPKCQARNETVRVRRRIVERFIIVTGLLTRDRIAGGAEVAVVGQLVFL
jgi:hypothetical protein